MTAPASRLTQALLFASSDLRLRAFRSPSFLSLVASERSARRANQGGARFLVEVSSSSGTASLDDGGETEVGAGLEAVQAGIPHASPLLLRDLYKFKSRHA
jgi:hypothetical protein